MNEKKVHQAHVALTRLRKEAEDVESQEDNGVDRDNTRHLEPEIAESDDGNSFGTDGDDEAIDIAQMLMETIRNVQDVSHTSPVDEKKRNQLITLCNRFLAHLSGRVLASQCGGPLRTRCASK